MLFFIIFKVIAIFNCFRFKTFEVSLRDITELVERWDRTIGAPRPTTSPHHEGDDHHTHPHSGRKGKKEKGDKHVKHEVQEVAKVEKEVNLLPSLLAFSNLISCDLYMREH